MKNLEFYFSFYLFLLMCFMFSYNFKHLLLTIISLEFIMISMIYNMFIILLNVESGMYLIIFVLIFTVSEGALSLSLLVLLIRFYGNDYINSLSLIKW